LTKKLSFVSWAAFLLSECEKTGERITTFRFFSAEIPVFSIQSEKIKSQTALQDSGIFY